MGFRYEPLKSNEIRLLKPLSRSSTLLSFELVHLSLLSKPCYAAVSYRWETRSDHEILLDGCPFLIGQNLWNALSTIQDGKHVDQYLWVDAICINQGGDEEAVNERSLQVTLMTQVYEQASKVLVWLGKPVNEVNNQLAFEMMEYFSKRFLGVQKKRYPYRPWWWPRKAVTSGDILADFLVAMSPVKDKKVFDVPGSRTHRAWLGVVSLWKSPWWTRTWIFQESTVPEPTTVFITWGAFTTVGKIKVKFLCGNQVTSWAKLSATLVVASNIVRTPGIESNFLTDAITPINNLLRLRNKRVQHILGSFLDILQMFRHTECTDPRDKVYVPLFLASEDARRHIKPDYASKTVRDVYGDVVRYCLEQPMYNLDFLGYAHYDDETQTVETPQGIKSVLPSWVPNFSASLTIIPIPKVLHVPGPGDLDRKRRVMPIDRRSIPQHNEKLIAAYGVLDGIPSKAFIEENTLFVTGVYIDVLKDIIAPGGRDLEAMKAFAREKSRGWAKDLKYKYFSGESYHDAINRTVVMDVAYDDLARASERGYRHDLEFLKKPPAELSATEYRAQINMKVSRDRAFTLRILGLSEKGYLLMVPNTAMVGDVVWALAGGQVLYMLRPVDRNLNKYRFIGECYAHGLMDGEVARWLRVGEAKMEDISLI